MLKVGLSQRRWWIERALCVCVCMLVCFQHLISSLHIYMMAVLLIFTFTSHNHSHTHTHTHAHTPLHLAAGCQLSLSWPWFIAKGGNCVPVLFLLHLLRNSRTHMLISSQCCVYKDIYTHIGHLHTHSFTAWVCLFLEICQFHSWFSSLFLDDNMACYVLNLLCDGLWC